MNARFAGTPRHPGIVSWVWAIFGEIDTLVLAKVCFGATYHAVRHEWGANANPHIHRNLISVSFCKFLEGLQKRLNNEITRIGEVMCADDPTLARDTSRSSVEAQVRAAWELCQNDYIRRVGTLYTNWNAGLTKKGRRTFNFNSTVYFLPFILVFTWSQKH